MKTLTHTFFDGSAVDSGGAPARSPIKVKLQSDYSEAYSSAEGKCARPYVLPDGRKINCHSSDFERCPACARRYHLRVQEVIKSGLLAGEFCVAATIPVPLWHHSVEAAVIWAMSLPALKRNAVEAVRRELGRDVQFAWCVETSQSGAPHIHLIFRLPYVATQADADAIRRSISGTRTRKGSSDGRFIRIPELDDDAVKLLGDAWNARSWADYLTKDVAFSATSVVTPARAAALVATAHAHGASLRASRNFGYSGRRWGVSRGWSRVTMKTIRADLRERFYTPAEE